MYEQFYGLKEKPFSLTPDPEFLFVNGHYQSALDQVLYGIQRREGFTVIVGDVGTGKTTLCWAILGRLERDLQTALILNPMLTAEDMLRAILQDFGVKRRRCGGSESQPSDAAGTAWMQGLTRKELIDELNLFLIERAEEDVFCVLIIDEAQDLSMDVLEQLRLLSNLETSKKKLLQIIFVGQIEFNEKLKTRELRSLNQRISIRYELKPLPKEDTVRYVAHRLKVAKAPARLVFTPGALREVHRFSCGYPRLVNLVCDRALLAGYSAESSVITAKMVRKAAAGLSGYQASAGTGLVHGARSFARLFMTIGIVMLGLALFWGWRSLRPLPPRPPDQVAALTAVDARVPVAPPAPEPAAPPPAPAAAAAQYYVQVHSFIVEQQAARAARRLKEQGFEAAVRTHVARNGTEWWIVVVGPFPDYEGARNCVAGLPKTRRSSSPIIVRSEGP